MKIPSELRILSMRTSRTSEPGADNPAYKASPKRQHTRPQQISRLHTSLNRDNPFKQDAHPVHPLPTIIRLLPSINSFSRQCARWLTTIFDSSLLNYSPPPFDAFISIRSISSPTVKVRKSSLAAKELQCYIVMEEDSHPAICTTSRLKDLTDFASTLHWPDWAPGSISVGRQGQWDLRSRCRKL